MMCAILSDTVIFKSPTCTKLDTKIVKQLAKIAKIDDFKALGLEMFKVKSDVLGVPMENLIKRDYKPFDMYGQKVGIGQLEVVDLSIFDEIKDDLKIKLKEFKEQNNLHTILLLLTDIIKVGSEILVVSDDENIVKKAFKKDIKNNSFWLDGCLSRKKQVVPILEPCFQK
jgi:manganese-dependent inorganic pyrophosphatase